MCFDAVRVADVRCESLKRSLPTGRHNNRQTVTETAVLVFGRAAMKKDTLHRSPPFPLLHPLPPSLGALTTNIQELAYTKRPPLLPLPRGPV